MDFRMIEKLEPCPYNSTHQILPHRMAKHITKCKKNYPDAEMKVCLFNAVHVVPAHQYHAHLLECENRELVERDLYCRPEVIKKSPLTMAEPLSIEDIVANSEDWESECVQSSYVPEEHVIYKEFTRPPPPGLSKGARKQWRLNEIERVNRLKNGMKVVMSPSNISSTSEMTATSVNEHWAASGAIPKFQNRFKCELSSGSSLLNYQKSQKQEHCNTDASVSNLSESSQYSGNRIDKIQEQKYDFIKEKRKLEKKLFEIKKLENMKTNLNEKLTDQEESKILLKENIEKKLFNLMKFIGV